MSTAPRLAPWGTVTTDHVLAAAKVGTPAYLYDEAQIVKHCQDILGMPNAYGLGPRFAMKANSSRAILQIGRAHV